MVAGAAQTGLLGLLGAPLMDGKALLIQGKAGAKRASLGSVRVYLVMPLLLVSSVSFLSYTFSFPASMALELRIIKLILLF